MKSLTDIFRTLRGAATSMAADGQITAITTVTIGLAQLDQIAEEKARRIAELEQKAKDLEAVIGMRTKEFEDIADKVDDAAQFLDHVHGHLRRHGVEPTITPAEPAPPSDGVYEPGDVAPKPVPVVEVFVAREALA